MSITIMILTDSVVFFRNKGTKEAEALHQVPDDGAGERVPQQLLHHATEALGDLVQAAALRAAGQGMVPEPQDEEEKAHREGQDSHSRRPGKQGR